MRKFIVAEVLKWAFRNKYEKAQGGLGRNSAITAILHCLKIKRDEFKLAFAEINTENRISNIPKGLTSSCFFGMMN